MTRAISSLVLLAAAVAFPFVAHAQGLDPGAGAVGGGVLGAIAGNVIGSGVAGWLAGKKAVRERFTRQARKVAEDEVQAHEHRWHSREAA